MVLLLDAMAACPELHELIHKDADEHDHQCAVTMFAQGKVESATVEVPIPEATAIVQAEPQIIFSVFTPDIRNLSQARAPPFLFAVS